MLKLKTQLLQQPRGIQLLQQPRGTQLRPPEPRGIQLLPQPRGIQPLPPQPRQSQLECALMTGSSPWRDVSSSSTQVGGDQ